MDIAVHSKPYCCRNSHAI